MKRLVSYALTLFIIGLLVFRIYSGWDSLGIVEWNWRFSIVTFVVYLFGIYAVNVISWHYLTRYLGISVSLKNNTYVWLFSNLTRLIPGGIWQYPSRVLLLKRLGVSNYKATLAVIFEVLFSLSMGIVVVFATLPFWELPESIAEYRSLLYLFFIVPVTVFFVMSNKKIILLLAKYYGKFTKKSVSVTHIDFENKYFVVVLLLFILRFLVIGYALYLLVGSVSVISSASSISIIGMYALSWLLGFIVIFAPGGLGVTEGVLTLMLGSYVSVTLAAAISLSFRVLIMSVEGICLGLAKVFISFPESKKM